MLTELRTSPLVPFGFVLAALVLLWLALRDRRRHVAVLERHRASSGIAYADGDEGPGMRHVMARVRPPRITLFEVYRTPADTDRAQRAVGRAMSAIAGLGTRTPHANESARGVGVAAVVTPSTEGCRQASPHAEVSSPLLFVSTPSHPSPMPTPLLDAFERTRFRDLKGEFRLLRGRDPNVEESHALHVQARKYGAHVRQAHDCAACFTPIADVGAATLVYGKHAKRGKLVHPGDACLTLLGRRVLVARVITADAIPAQDADRATPEDA